MEPRAERFHTCSFPGQPGAWWLLLPEVTVKVSTSWPRAGAGLRALSVSALLPQHGAAAVIPTQQAGHWDTQGSHS